MRPKIITTAALGIVAAMVVVGVSQAASSAKRHPQTAKGWVRTITNPYLPYRPGSVWVYRGIKDGVAQTDTVTVTHRTKTILGVRTTVLTDVATHGARLLETTTDYYAQDARGNVWYFGEATKAYGPHGQVDTSGSWQAGVHNAKQGIVMTAHPQVGDTHRQEYQRGVAEDQYWLVDMATTLRVPFGSFTNAAHTIEWSRLEPSVIDEKFYVPGIGVVREVAAQGPTEFANLVSYTH
jgi:hypothetical protein